METENATWKEEEQRLKSKEEPEIALAKMDSSKDQQHEQTRWEEKINELKQELENAIRQELEQKLKELRTQLVEEQDEKVNAVRQEWKRMRKLEADSKIKKTREDWEQELAQIFVEAEQSAVAKFKHDWARKQKDLDQDHHQMAKSREEDITQSQVLTAVEKEEVWSTEEFKKTFRKRKGKHGPWLRYIRKVKLPEKGLKCCGIECKTNGSFIYHVKEYHFGGKRGFTTNLCDGESVSEKM